MSKRKGPPRHQNQKEFTLLYAPQLQELKDKTPRDHLCPHCFDKIEWKLKFGKYKKLTQPARCTVCDMKTVVKAYRQICDKCSDDHGICSMCREEKSLVPFTDQEKADLQKLRLDQLVENNLKQYKECSRRKLLRLLSKDKVKLVNDVWLYTDSLEAVQNLRLKEKFKEGEDAAGVDEDEEDSADFASDDLDD